MNTFDFLKNKINVFCRYFRNFHDSIEYWYTLKDLRNATHILPSIYSIGHSFTESILSCELIEVTFIQKENFEIDKFHINISHKMLTINWLNTQKLLLEFKTENGMNLS